MNALMHTFAFEAKATLETVEELIAALQELRRDYPGLELTSPHSWTVVRETLSDGSYGYAIQVKP